MFHENKRCSKHSLLSTYSKGTGSVNQFVEYFRFDGFFRSSYFFGASTIIRGYLGLAVVFGSGSVLLAHYWDFQAFLIFPIFLRS